VTGVTLVTDIPREGVSKVAYLESFSREITDADCVRLNPIAPEETNTSCCVRGALKRWCASLPMPLNKMRSYASNKQLTPR